MGLAQRDEKIIQLESELQQFKKSTSAFKAQNQNIGQSRISSTMKPGVSNRTPVNQPMGSRPYRPPTPTPTPARQQTTYNKSTLGGRPKNIRKHNKKNHTNSILLAVLGVLMLLAIAVAVKNNFLTDSGGHLSSDRNADPSPSGLQTPEPEEQQKPRASLVAKQRNDALATERDK